MSAEPGDTLLRRLLLALLPALLALAALGASVDYWQVRSTVDATFDTALANTAFGLAARLESERDDDLGTHIEQLLGAVSRRNPEARFAFVIVDEAGHVIAGMPALRVAAAGLPDEANPAFADAELAGRPVRLARYRYAGPDGRALIVVAESLAARRGATAAGLRSSMVANLLSIVAVLGIVTLGVRAALRPLRELGARVARHDTGALQPLPLDGVPGEVRPLVDGFNSLLERLRRSTAAQQAFLSASAHQLRTPLAGLQSQLELLRDELRGTPSQARAAGLDQTIRRLTRVTEQMLALSRTDAQVRGEAAPAPDEAVDLEALLQELAGQHLDATLDRGLDLGLETEPVRVAGERWMLREMTANLIDNALRHAPPHSSVTLRCGPLSPQGERAESPALAFLEVEDAGPGIPLAERERVFERFVRLRESDGSGSGLGLAIVREVAGHHRARVRILDGLGGHGTRVRVEFTRG